jgi:hypothetical protein
MARLFNEARCAPRRRASPNPTVDFHGEKRSNANHHRLCGLTHHRPAAGGCGSEDAVDEKPAAGGVAAVEAELELAEVGRQVLVRDAPMEGAQHGALEEREPMRFFGKSLIRPGADSSGRLPRRCRVPTCSASRSCRPPEVEAVSSSGPMRTRATKTTRSSNLTSQHPATPISWISPA